LLENISQFESATGQGTAEGFCLNELTQEEQRWIEKNQTNRSREADKQASKQASKQAVGLCNVRRATRYK
jgi:hypothetical protein